MSQAVNSKLAEISRVKNDQINKSFIHHNNFIAFFFLKQLFFILIFNFKKYFYLK